MKKNKQYIITGILLLHTSLPAVNESTKNRLEAPVSKKNAPLKKDHRFSNNVKPYHLGKTQTQTVMGKKLGIKLPTRAIASEPYNSKKSSAQIDRSDIANLSAWYSPEVTPDMLKDMITKDIESLQKSITDQDEYFRVNETFMHLIKLYGSYIKDSVSTDAEKNLYTEAETALTQEIENTLKKTKGALQSEAQAALIETKKDLDQTRKFLKEKRVYSNEKASSQREELLENIKKLNEKFNEAAPVFQQLSKMHALLNQSIKELVESNSLSLSNEEQLTFQEDLSFIKDILDLHEKNIQSYLKITQFLNDLEDTKSELDNLSKITMNLTQESWDLNTFEIMTDIQLIKGFLYHKNNQDSLYLIQKLQSNEALTTQDKKQLTLLEEIITKEIQKIQLALNKGIIKRISPFVKNEK